MSHPVALNEFDFDGNAVRTIIDEYSEVWFVAKDVADILGYAETSNMTERLDDDEKRKHTLQNGRNYTNQTLINESGLYNAVMGSQKLEAKRF
ncbi:Bro-N domain-containing protein [Pseudescherichia sp.]|uniref:BRO-N domain-containing protein n=1 Tax=Pseudescherichia sp. TaxID=2055881 RepID=UPI00289A41C3|nr:Bro-N domain-containing protein [Pseudescherichia sp.]